MFQLLIDSQELDWKLLELKRGELLSRAGEVEKYIYWVQEGAIRAYSIVEEKEFTVRFGYKNSLITSLSSYISEKPGELYLEAIRKSRVLQCSKHQLESFIGESKERLIAYKEILEEQVIGFMEREHDLMLQDPKSRLERVRARSPQLFQEIPHKYIAAYLRMSPETLSRILNS